MFNVSLGRGRLGMCKIPTLGDDQLMKLSFYRVITRVALKYADTREGVGRLNTSTRVGEDGIVNASMTFISKPGAWGRSCPLSDGRVA